MCFLIIGVIMTPTVLLRATGETAIDAAHDPKTIIVKYYGKEPRKLAVPAGQTVLSMIRRYERLASVEYAEPNYLVSASALPSDEYFSNQWYLKRIQAPEAWDVNTQSKNIVIAVIDSGVQVHHPDLEANMWTNPAEIKNNNKDDDRNGLIDDIYGWDFVNNFADPSPKFHSGFTEGGIIHGTVVASIAAGIGNNNIGVSGITWQAKIMALKALDDKGNGDTDAVIKSIDYAVAKGANVINLSFVGFGYSRSLQDAIARAVNAGVIVVAAGGNEQPTHNGLNLDQRPLYPACYRDAAGKKLVIGVAATDALDQKAEFSGFGTRCIDISAPGIGFYTGTVYAPDKSSDGKFFNQFYDGYWSGTSMAVPIISGTVALIQGTNPNLNREEVINLLLQNSDNINQLNPAYYGQLGRGRVNVFRSIYQTVAQLRAHTGHIVVGAQTGKPIVRVLDQYGNSEREFFAYRSTFTGGVNVASGDIDRDLHDEIITAPAKNLESDIRIYRPNGVLVSHFLAYPVSYQGGVNVAVSDIDGDGRSEIITVPASGYKAEVKIWNKDGKLLRSFLAYPTSFTGGASLAIADVRDTGLKEIITAPGKGGIPQIKIFSREGKLLNHFLAGPRSANYGYRVAAADLDGNPRRKQAEIIVSRQTGEPIIELFDYRGGKRKSFLAYTPPFRGDVRITAADLNRDGFTDIITVPGSAGGPLVRLYDYRGNFVDSFYAPPGDYTGGLSISVLLTHN